MSAPPLGPEHVRRRVAANLEWPRPSDRPASAGGWPRGGLAARAGRRIKQLIRRHPSLGRAMLVAARALLLPVHAVRRTHAAVLRFEQGVHKLARFLRQQDA
jgi:hypothetical protein